MANRITRKFNDLLAERHQVEEFYTKSHGNRIERSTVDFSYGQKIEVSSIDMYYRVEGYDLYDNEANNARVLNDLSNQLTNFAHSRESCFVYSIYGKDGELSVFYGSDSLCASAMKSSLAGNMFNAKISNTWISRINLNEVQKCNGVILGASRLLLADIDSIVNAMQNEDFFINFVSIPCSTEEVDDEIRRIDELQNAYQRVSKNEVILGSNRPRRFENDIHEVLNVMEILDREKKRLQIGRVGGLWQSFLLVSSSSQKGYDILTSNLVAILKSRKDSTKDNTVVSEIPLTYPFIVKSVWQIPDIYIGTKDYEGIYGNSFANIMSSQEIASFITLPLYPHRGFSVKHFGDSKVSLGAFDRIAPKITKVNTMTLGKTNLSQSFAIPIDDFRQHTLVTGAPRSGKSTTVQKILSDAYHSGIPFIVIESAKKEYWNMIKHLGLENIEIYSAGMDAKQLSINPFQPEDNTFLDTHIQNLIQALLTLFADPPPLPQIITSLVYMCYAKRGWEIDKRVSSEITKPYPILSDMLLYLDECIDAIDYGPQVNKDMKGVVRIRIGSLLLGQTALTLNTHENMSIKSLFETSAILELDDFADQSKKFVASLLAIKANEYSKQCELDGKLHRLLVVEEAHHILPNPEMRSVHELTAACSNYFANLLAEISAYGTGVMIVEQRASILSGAAIANTGVKIVHNVREGDDNEVLSRSLSLKEHESSMLNKLKVGQAVVSLPQQDEICLVQVDGKHELRANFNLGCLFCNKTGCYNRSSHITLFERNYIMTNGFTQKGISICMKAMESKSGISFTDQDRICLAGELSSIVTMNEQIKRQILHEYFRSLSV